MSEELQYQGTLKLGRILRTRRIRLRELTLADWPTIFAWRNRESFRFYVRSYDDVVSYSQFCTEFSSAAAVRPFQFIVETISQCEAIGYAYVHSVSEDGIRGFVNVYIADEYLARGYGVEACLLICRFLLTTTRVTFVFLQAFAYNAFSLSALRGAHIPEVDTDQRREHHGKEYRIYRFCISHEHMDRLNRLIYALCRNKTASEM